jgi:hypothetical protein
VTRFCGHPSKAHSAQGRSSRALGSHAPSAAAWSRVEAEPARCAHPLQARRSNPSLHRSRLAEPKRAMRLAAESGQAHPARERRSRTGFGLSTWQLCSHERRTLFHRRDQPYSSVGAQGATGATVHELRASHARPVQSNELLQSVHDAPSLGLATRSGERAACPGQSLTESAHLFQRCQVTSAEPDQITPPNRALIASAGPQHVASIVQPPRTSALALPPHKSRDRDGATPTDSD